MEEQLVDPNNQNPNVSDKLDSSKTKEEGELSSSSSSDDDDQIVCSGNQFTQKVHIDTVNENSQDTLAERCTSSKMSCSNNVPSITPQESGHLKNSKKNRKNFVPFLISFSDDSGSDCENSGQKKISATKNRTLAASGSNKPPAPAPQRPQKLQKIVRGEENMIPREGPVSHSVVSSLTKINGGPYGNVGRLHSVTNYNNVDKVVTLDHTKRTNVHLNSSKLQDLRHQLNELQRSQNTKDLTSASYRDSNLVNKRNFVVRASAETTYDNLQELKEPVKKRPKMVSPNPSLGLSDSQEITSMVIRSERRALKDSDKLEQDDHSSLREKDPSCSVDARRLKQNEYQGRASSTNPSLILKEGIDALRNHNQSSSNSSKEVANKAANKLDKTKPGSELSSQCKQPNLQNKVTSGPAGVNITEKSNCNLVRSNENAQKPAQNGSNTAASTHDVAKNAGANVTSPKFPSFWNCCDKLNISGSSSIDLQSLFHLEELQDKELEEAQEYRRKCEIEERNALKSYRKAQRALLEANARCSGLYNKREQYSAQLRDLMMGNPYLLSSSGPPQEDGNWLDPLPSASDVNRHLIPTSNCAVQHTFDFSNQRRCNLNTHPNSVALQNVSSVKKHCNLAADPSAEPDGIRFEHNKEVNDANGMCPPYEDINTSQNVDEDAYQLELSPRGIIVGSAKRAPDTTVIKKKKDAYQLEHESPENSPESSLDYQRKTKSSVDMEKNMNNTSERQSAMDSSLDSLLLEASLRSQLVERLRMRTLSQKASPQESLEAVAEGRSENDELVGRVLMRVDNGLYSDSERENEPQQGSDLQGCDKMSMSKIPVEVNHQCNNEKLGSIFAPHSSTVPLDSCITTGDNKSQFASSITFSNPILKSTLLHFKVSDSMDILKLQSRNSNVQTSHDHREDNFGSSTVPPSISSLGSVESPLVDLIGSNSGSYSCNFAIDPLWPLCIFELRGKCNNDDCSWQHFRDYSSGSRMKVTVDNEDKVGSPTQGQIFSATRMLTKSLDCLGLAPPTYLVGSDVLRADLQSCKSILSQEYGQPWMKCFSRFFVLSSQLPTDLSSDEPLFHGISAGVDVQEGWNRRSFYFQSRNGSLGSCNELSVDDDQIVEMALLGLSQEANKLKGRIQALKLVAQALEANPASAVLWIVYLLIYYSRQKSIGKEDMFQLAVEQSEGSYELWLLYINSRTRLDERLAAYDAALLSLCRHASASDTNALCASDCILDVFLQMMNCLCMSGNVAKTIEKINELYPTEKKSDNPFKLSLPDIITCLTISDKCIFWVCCVYLVVYRKLPDAIVRRFEYQKELSSIDWPFADLTLEEKRRGVSLMELAVDSLELYIDSESLEFEANLRAAHLFSVNHVKCIVVLKDLESSRSLLERYVKLYPSCLELVLMSARAEHDFADGSFEGFEDALDNWFDEVPGAQCIWNQYVQCALQDRKIDFVKELMARWFQSLWNCRDSQDGCLDTVDRGNSRGKSQALPQSASVSDIAALFSNSSQKDVVFGLLNCSIYKLLQNDYTEAQLAITWALGAASAENYTHCMREHLLFLTADNLHDNRQLLKLLCGYLADNRASATSEPLSTQFTKKIKKPRVRQLVGKLLCPASLEPSMVNAVLEAWYGPSLLPEKTDKLTNFVDMVESLMEILPSNYHLAISVCQQLMRSSDAATVSGTVSFWASSLLISALFQAVPVAPEYAWVEAADILCDLTGFRSRYLNFLKRALSIYPFSIMLWKSYFKLSEAEGNSESVKEAARQKGIELQ